MNLFTGMLTTTALLVSASTEAQTLVITRAGSRPGRAAPAGNFTGGVRVEPLFEALDPSDASGGSVTFEPGARTAWHSHPRGQILIVTAGTGRVQRWGGFIEEIRPGDVVRIPAGQKPEKVSDEQYQAAPSPERQAQPPQASSQPQGTTGPSGPLQRKLAPGLATLTDEVLFGDVWKRPELSPRDRSLVTISVLIATGKPAQLAGHLGRALDNGVQPNEASGLLAHLAIYCGWPSAVSALDVYEQVYTARKVDAAALRAVRPRLPRPASDAARARAVNDEFGAVAPKFVQLTNDVVFDNLWRQSDLTLRDRSLITIAALAAMGDDDQLDLYLRRGLESGLTRAQITEALTHLGFYAGWARATKAMTAITRTLGK
jgi:4-carboxymuconolactone decarboxylase